MEPFLLCVQDPADPLNDLGYKAFGIKHIQETLKQLHADLKKKVDNPIPGRTPILLDMLLENSYTKIMHRRAITEAFVPKQV